MKKFLVYLLLFSFIIISLFACKPKDDTPASTPAPPTTVGVQLRSHTGNAEVTLDWPMVAGADTYNLYYVKSATQPSDTEMKAYGTLITGLLSAPYTVTGLTNGTMYWFAFSSVNTSNGEGDLSEIIPATPSTTPPPAFPQNVRANAGDGQVTVTWDPVTANPTIASYNIHCMWTDGLNVGYGIITSFGQANNSQVVDSITWILGPDAGTTTGLTNGTLYAFYLTAETAETGPSAIVSVAPSTTSSTSKVTDGTVVTSISATMGTTGQVTISWEALSSATPYTSYNLYYYPTNAGSPITRIPEFGTATNIISGLTDNTSYSFYLTSVTSSEVSFSALATPSANPPPAAPTNLSVTEYPTTAAGYVIVAWDAVTDATSYNIYIGMAKGVTKDTGAQSNIASDGSASYSVEATLANGTYYIVVTAENANGESTESKEVPITITDNP